MSDGKITLHYWAGRGLMEVARVLFALAGKFPEADYEGYFILFYILFYFILFYFILFYFILFFIIVLLFFFLFL